MNGASLDKFSKVKPWENLLKKIVRIIPDNPSNYQIGTVREKILKQFPFLKENFENLLQVADGGNKEKIPALIKEILCLITNNGKKQRDEKNKSIALLEQVQKDKNEITWVPIDTDEEIGPFRLIREVRR